MNCTQCASLLIYEPGQPHFHCPSCQTTYPFGESHLFTPHPLVPSLEEAASLPEAQAFVCSSCGASTEVGRGDMNRKCPFCGNALGSESTPCKHFEPQWVLPFRLTKDKALQKIIQWNAQRSRFQKMADRLPSLDPAEVLKDTRVEPVYLPFWIYIPDEKARRKVTFESPKLHDVLEKTNGKTRIPARIPQYNGSAFPRQELYALEPWPLNKLVPYDPLFLSQVPVEVAQMDLKESYQSFANSIAFYDLYLDALGGTIDIESLRQMPLPIRVIRHNITEIPTWSQFLNAQQLSFTQCLLPAWICHLTVNGKTHKVYVNAATGEVVWDMNSFGSTQDANTKTVLTWGRYALGCMFPTMGMILAALVFLLTRNEYLTVAIIILSPLTVPVWFFKTWKANRKVDLGSGEGSSSGSAQEARHRRLMEGGSLFSMIALPLVFIISFIAGVVSAIYTGRSEYFLAGGFAAFLLSSALLWLFSREANREIGTVYSVYGMPISLSISAVTAVLTGVITRLPEYFFVGGLISLLLSIPILWHTVGNKKLKE